MIVRRESSEDREAVYRINREAFGQRDEADLVDRLRASGRVVLALVAELDGRPVGHILFSTAEIVGAGGSCPAITLAPVAVLPALQNRGIGSALVRDGLDRLAAEGHERVIVLGHPDYYPRFGFEAAGEYGIQCPIEAPKEAFMALALKPGALEDCQGTLRWAPEFGIGADS